MKRLDTLLKRWQEAGLMTVVQADGIRQFEDARGKGKWGYSFYALGAFSVLLGVVAVVAANWWNIPSDLKLGLHVAVNAGLACFIWRNFQQGRRTLNEYLIYALAALTLTLIALIGQTFQMGGDFTNALRLWSILVAPMLWFFGDTARQGRVFGLLWLLIGFLWLPHFVQSMEENLQGKVLHVTSWLWLLAAGLALPRLTVHKAFGDIIVYDMAWILLIFSSFNSLIPYISSGDIKNFDIGFAMAVNAIVAGLGIFLYHKEKNLFNGTVLLAALMGFFSLFFVGSDSAFYAAMLFVLYWLAVACLGYKLNYARIFVIAVWLIAIRLFIAYIEVFGSLARTGAGLIVTGLIFIAMAYVTRNIQKRFLVKGDRA
jgi:uncharacterized membrane protein